MKRLRGWLEPRILGLGALIAAALWLFIEPSPGAPFRQVARYPLAGTGAAI